MKIAQATPAANTYPNEIEKIKHKRGQKEDTIKSRYPPPTSTHALNMLHSKRVSSDKYLDVMSPNRPHYLGEVDMSVIEREDRRVLGRSRTREVPSITHAQEHIVHSPRGDTKAKRMASPQTLINERAIEPTVNEVVLEWGPNNDPIGRLQAMIDDKTEMPKLIDAPHMPLHNPSDAHRR